ADAQVLLALRLGGRRLARQDPSAPDPHDEDIGGNVDATREPRSKQARHSGLAGARNTRDEPGTVDAHQRPVTSSTRTGRPSCNDRRAARAMASAARASVPPT